VWVVVADADLRSLLLTIGDEAGVDLDAVEPGEARWRLSTGDSPAAMLVERGALDASTAVALAKVPRLAIAAAVMSEERSGDGPGLLLPLPASLTEIERVLHWLSWDGSQVKRSSKRAVNSDLPASI
jgi:hypothetical protein